LRHAGEFSSLDRQPDHHLEESLHVGVSTLDDA